MICTSLSLRVSDGGLHLIGGRGRTIPSPPYFLSKTGKNDILVKKHRVKKHKNPCLPAGRQMKNVCFEVCVLFGFCVLRFVFSLPCI